MQEQLQAIVMAAGRASRFKTNRSKLVEKICGQEMILYVTKTLEKLKMPVSVIVGYKKAELQNVITRQHGTKINFIEQKEQKGTAHALMCSQSSWQQAHILIMNGDMPLISTNLLTDLWQQHLAQDAAVSFVVATSDDPAFKSYGKVVSPDGQVKIIEAKDYQALIAQDPQSHSDSSLINAGIYIFRTSFLELALAQLQTSSVTGEFYITDLIGIASAQQLTVSMLQAPVDQIRGINTLQELWLVEQIKQTEIIHHWQQNGVRFAAPQNCYIDLNVVIGAGTVIGQGVQITGNSDVQDNCYIESFNLIDNSQIGENSIIQAFCILQNSYLRPNSLIAPYTQVKQNHETKQLLNNTLVSKSKTRKNI